MQNTIFEIWKENIVKFSEKFIKWKNDAINPVVTAMLMELY